MLVSLFFFLVRYQGMRWDYIKRSGFDPTLSSSHQLQTSKQKLGGGNSNIFWFSPRKLGKWSNLTVAYFCTWVGSTWNHQLENIILQQNSPALRMDPYAVVHWTGAEVLHLDRFLGAEFQSLKSGMWKKTSVSEFKQVYHGTIFIL